MNSGYEKADLRKVKEVPTEIQRNSEISKRKEIHKGWAILRDDILKEQV